MCDDQSRQESKASRTETDVYIDGQHYVQVIVTDYYGRVVYSNLYKQ